MNAWPPDLRSSPEAWLLAAFDRAGRVRFPNPAARAEGAVDHKGVEVRLRARDDDELDDLQYALRSVGIQPGRPFAHGRGWVLPCYGREAASWFLSRRPGTTRITQHHAGATSRP